MTVTGLLSPSSVSMISIGASAVPSPAATPVVCCTEDAGSSLFVSPVFTVATPSALSDPSAAAVVVTSGDINEHVVDASASERQNQADVLTQDDIPVGAEVEVGSVSPTPGVCEPDAGRDGGGSMCTKAVGIAEGSRCCVEIIIACD